MSENSTPYDEFPPFNSLTDPDRLETDPQDLFPPSVAGVMLPYERQRAQNAYLLMVEKSLKEFEGPTPNFKLNTYDKSSQISEEVLEQIREMQYQAGSNNLEGDVMTTNSEISEWLKDGSMVVITDKENLVVGWINIYDLDEYFLEQITSTGFKLNKDTLPLEVSFQTNTNRKNTPPGTISAALIKTIISLTTGEIPISHVTDRKTTNKSSVLFVGSVETNNHGSTNTHTAAGFALHPHLVKYSPEEQPAGVLLKQVEIKKN